MAQHWISGLIVAASAGYVLWALLLPQAARQVILRALRRLPLPAALANRLGSLPARRSSCACDGCGQRTVAAPVAEPQPVHWVVGRRR